MANAETRATQRDDWAGFDRCPSCAAVAGEACWSLAQRRELPGRGRAPQQRKRRPCAGRPELDPPT